MFEAAIALSALVFAYLLGSVPFGFVIAKGFCGVDPRQAGSRNVGATNVARLCGTTWGVLTLLCDVLKGFLPVLGTYYFLSEQQPFLFLGVGLAVVCGHMFSCFLRFKGGKGVATTIGVFLAVAPLQLIVAGAVCIFVIWRTGYVSAGSLTLVGALPILFIFMHMWPLLVLSLVIGSLVVYAHRENISRLMCGEEKTWQKKKP